MTEVNRLSTMDRGALTRSNRPRRWWPRFGLRTLAGAVTLLCVALSWLAFRSEHARRQERIVASMPFLRLDYDYQDGTQPPRPPRGPAFLRRILGEHAFSDIAFARSLDWPRHDEETVPVFDPVAFARVEELSALEVINLDHYVGPHLTDADLSHLAPLHRLQMIIISSPEITDAGLRHLAGLTNLRYLNLNCPKVTGAGLAVLSQCSKLDHLSLRMPISAEGFAAIGRLPSLLGLDLLHPMGDFAFQRCASLTQLAGLEINSQGASGYSLRYLRRLKSLEKLDCPGIRIEPGDLKPLHDLPKLRQLQFSPAEIDDAALADLAGLSSLKTLDLSESSITDAGLEHLYALGLADLQLRGTAVTGKGLAKLPRVDKYFLLLWSTEVDKLDEALAIKAQ